MCAETWQCVCRVGGPQERGAFAGFRILFSKHKQTEARGPTYEQKLRNRNLHVKDGG